MKKTICDLCGDDVRAGGMFGGTDFITTKWNHGPNAPDITHTIEVRLKVSAINRASQTEHNVDLCAHCLRGFLSALPECNKPV